MKHTFRVKRSCALHIALGCLFLSLMLMPCWWPTAQPLLSSPQAAPTEMRAAISQRWSASEIVQHMSDHPNRAYFADFFRYGGFRSGIEVGVADGRFSEHFLLMARQIPLVWHMIEPYPNENLKKRFYITANGTANFQLGTWAQGLTQNAHLYFHMDFSTDKRTLQMLPDEAFDFVYLDGAHDNKNVRRELPRYYQKVRPGGVLAGHDYCNWGEPARKCLGCEDIPKCQPYTEFGVQHGKKKGVIARNQDGVVSAIQQWLVDEHPELRLYHTIEDFSQESLMKDDMAYDLVITNTRNPSWFVIKPAST